jgi:hypothetical protein
MGEFRIAFLKIAALFSFCGGPLLVSDRLKPHFGPQVAFLVTFVPVGLMFFGALFLEEDIGDRLARVAVWLGRQALYVVVAMHVYAVWRFANGLRVSEQYLYYIGIGVGFVWAMLYLYTARRWATPPNHGSVNDGHQEGRPIEPS